MTTYNIEMCARCGREDAIHLLDMTGVNDLDEPIEVARVCSTVGTGVYIHPTTMPEDVQPPEASAVESEETGGP